MSNEKCKDGSNIWRPEIWEKNFERVLDTWQCAGDDYLHEQGGQTPSIPLSSVHKIRAQRTYVSLASIVYGQNGEPRIPEALIIDREGNGVHAVFTWQIDSRVIKGCKMKHATNDKGVIDFQVYKVQRLGEGSALYKVDTEPKDLDAKEALKKKLSDVCFEAVYVDVERK